jgi:hypothetical protein
MGGVRIQGPAKFGATAKTCRSGLVHALQTARVGVVCVVCVGGVTGRERLPVDFARAINMISGQSSIEKRSYKIQRELQDRPREGAGARMSLRRRRREHAHIRRRSGKNSKITHVELRAQIWQLGHFPMYVEPGWCLADQCTPPEQGARQQPAPSPPCQMLSGSRTFIVTFRKAGVESHSARAVVRVEGTQGMVRSSR